MTRTLALAAALLLAAPALGAEKKEKPEVTILSLYDSFGREAKGATQDFGFSALITYAGKTILFDSGANADLWPPRVQVAARRIRQRLPARRARIAPRILSGSP